MSEHSITEAKHRLSELIDRTLRGEGVVITRDGHPVVELKAVMSLPRRMTRDTIESLAARRVGRRAQTSDGVALVRQMRDEWEG
jgi:prevent-host-death family protein